jgi:hypothetical protein
LASGISRWNGILNDHTLHAKDIPKEGCHFYVRKPNARYFLDTPLSEAGSDNNSIASFSVLTFSSLIFSHGRDPALLPVVIVAPGKALH